MGLQARKRPLLDLSMMALFHHLLFQVFPILLLIRLRSRSLMRMGIWPIDDLCLRKCRHTRSPPLRGM